MIIFDEKSDVNKITYDYKDQLIPNHLYSIFINGDLLTEKAYSLLTLIREQSYLDKNYLVVKYPFENECIVQSVKYNSLSETLHPDTLLSIQMILVILRLQ